MSYDDSNLVRNHFILITELLQMFFTLPYYGSVKINVD